MSFEEILISKTALYMAFTSVVTKGKQKCNRELSNYEGKEKWLSDIVGMLEKICIIINKNS